MASYYVYDPSTGRILRAGCCPADMIEKQGRPGESEIAVEGVADDLRQKVVAGILRDKSSEEIEAAQPKPISYDDQPAGVTRKQWQDLQARLAALETKVGIKED
jgi:hypothetical protein